MRMDASVTGSFPATLPSRPTPGWVQADSALGSIARLMRRVHDASVGFDLGEVTWSGEMADPVGGEVTASNARSVDLRRPTSNAERLPHTSPRAQERHLGAGRSARKPATYRGHATRSARRR
jgi:hypothetical protein